jgi:hypothetical protein
VNVPLGETIISCSAFSTESENDDDECWKWKSKIRKLMKIGEGAIGAIASLFVLWSTLDVHIYIGVVC